MALKRLTTPEEMNLKRRLYPTGNHFVSLPVIGDADASVDRVGVLHQGTASLIEFGGLQAELGAETLPAIQPLLVPLLMVKGRRIRLDGGLSWRRLWDWVPRFEWTDPSLGLRVRGTIFAPVFRDGEGLQSHKGFVYVLEVAFPEGAAGDSTATVPADLRVGLSLTWGDLIQTVYTSRRVPAELTVRRDRWTGGPVLEPRSGAGAGPAALAVSFSVSADEVEWSPVTDSEGRVRLEMTADLISAPGKAAARSEGVGGAATRSEGAPEGHTGGPSLAFYFGVNREGDGARTVAVDLSRHGWEKLLRETGAALGRLHRAVAVHPPSDRPAITLTPEEAAIARTRGEAAVALTPEEAAVIERRLNENLLFNYFFAAGRTIDTEELALVTSRSPLYYVSAAFWARDALLWSLPGLILTDPRLAEEALGQAFGRYFRHAGVHSLYLDGGLLDPGFELDELAAYPIALRRYVTATGDRGILSRRDLAGGLRRILALLEQERHPDPGIHLYRTFLLPSDDPATHPYVTYDNVMVWRALLDMADLLEWAGEGDMAGETPAALRTRAALVKESIFQHCVIPGRAGPMFAWSVDSAGETEVADEPPGSLELLTYYGFCPSDNEVWLNTMGWLHSRENPYRYTGVSFPGLGCPHAKHPFVMSLFNALLGGLPERIDEAKGVLVRASLDTGLACEAFDRETGEVKTGAAFATCAGFLGYAIDHVFGR
jgi:hypothetical protein